MKEVKVYSRIYDGEKAGFSDDSRPNSLLGTFTIEQQLTEDMYSEQFIGIRKEDGKRYLVDGREVSGMYNPKMGGMRYSITELNQPQKEDK